MSRTLRNLAPLVAVPLFFVAACAPESNSANNDSASDPSADSTELTEVLSCAIPDLNLKTPGKLTIATDSPAYPPWFVDDDPTNGKGFESAVAYALADEMGFAKGDVTWVKVPFNNSYKPGAKKFDFDINQIAITPERSAVVDFSNSYYSASQGVIALKGTPGAAATSLDDLKGLRLGAQTGTTSLTAIRDVIQPTSEPLVFSDTNAAKQALQNDQVDAIVADLPTAFYITEFEIPKSAVVGQIQSSPDAPEEFGLLFEKGNALKECVDFYIDGLAADGTLAQLEKDWLPDSGVPELQ